MKKTLALALAMMMAATMLLTGCGSGGSEERVVNVCSWGEYIDEDLIYQFEEETGIKVNYQTAESNEALYSLIKMGGADFDVIVPSDYMIGRLIEEDMLAELDYSNIPNFGLIDDQYKGLSYDPDNKYTVPYTWGTLGIIYNTTMVDEPITSWDAMFDTKYAGNVLMFNNSRDALGIALMDLGIAGAALATVAGYCVGGVIPLIYFLTGERSGLRLGKTKLYGRQLLQACANGSSELMSNISSSIVSILYNLQLMRLIGETGVAAYSVMMYVDFVFLAAFLGFSVGSAPIVSFHYGADNRSELKSVFRKSAVIIGVTAVVMVTASELLSHPLSSAFVGYDPDLLEMTVHGFRLFALNYLFCGVNIYASAFFTALCNGLISALISFARTLLLRGGMVLLLPLLWGLDGIWWAVVAAEGLAVLVSLAFLISQRKRYHYA